MPWDPTFLSAELTVFALTDPAPISTDSLGGHTSSPAKAWAPLRDPLIGAEQIRKPECAHTSYLSLACIFPRSQRHPEASCLFLIVTSTEPYWCSGMLSFRQEV